MQEEKRSAVQASVKQEAKAHPSDSLADLKTNKSPEHKKATINTDTLGDILPSTV